MQLQRAGVFGTSLHLLSHTQGNMRDRTVLSALHRQQKLVSPSHERVYAQPREEGEGILAGIKHSAVHHKAEELQEYALLQAGVRQLALHEGPHLLHLQEVTLPEEVLHLLLEGRQVRRVLHLRRVREQRGRGGRGGRVQGGGAAEVGAVRHLQAIQRKRG